MLSSKTGIEDVGKMLLEVQNEMSNIKRQLDTIPHQAGGHEIPPSFLKLQNDLGRFEMSLKNKTEKFLFGALQNFGDNINNDQSRLPNIIHDVKSMPLIRAPKNIKCHNSFI